ncbi:hypothetical protein QYE76_023324 [Lolium multiflorum]|uniref:Uncharacterized protein n=1 Tax=Lolium multiflorum TaxID=4521 RepID=A0AAD8VS56_LOLMU|nr:hypothetical protein QYE76_023324 [Lolium multiflorum]
MARAHPMWLYSGSKDETRINAAELSEKELLDEVRRLTHFSQEDSIPLTSSHVPFDADHPPTEEAEALPSKRSSGGFANEDDLWDLDEGFIEPPPKKSKTGAAPSDLAASEASAPATIPAAQISTASSLSKGKNIPSAAAAATPPSGKPDLRAVISSLESFASQYASLEVDKAQLQKEVESSSSKLEGAIKIAAEARTEIDTLKEELEELKRRLKDEEAARLTAEARAMERDDLLRQSSLALLSNPLFVPFLIIAFANIDSFVNVFLHASFFSGAADIPVEALDEVPNNSPTNTLSMTLASHQLVQDLLQKGKGAMARIHLMIFRKISQDKTLGQLIDAFAVNTKEVIEVYPVPAFVDDSSGAVPESDRLQRKKDQIAQMEKDMRSTYALAAIINKKNEIAADAERYALTELHKATESLNSNLLSIAKAVGDLELLYPKVMLPANMIVDKLEKDSKTPEEKETPQE